MRARPGVWVFTLPLPLLEPSVLGATFTQGAALLMAGLLCYNWAALRPLMVQLWGRAKAA